MIDNDTEAINLIRLASDTLVKGNKYYREQADVLKISGVREMIAAMANRHHIEPHQAGFMVSVGVYLALRLKEDEQLDKLYGGK